MSDILRIVSAEPVVHGVLKIGWSDGYEGVVDLRGIMRDGALFESLRDPVRFRQVRVGVHGHSIFWGEDGNEDVDFGCDRLRELVEEQEDLILRAS